MTDLKFLLSALRTRDAWLRLESAAWEATNCTLVFSIDRGRGGRSASRWKVHCREVLGFRIDDVDGGGLAHVSRDHPAIDQFTAPWLQLGLNRSVDCPDRATGLLWTAHRKLFQDWIDFDRYLVLHPVRLKLSRSIYRDRPDDSCWMPEMEPDLDEIVAAGQGILSEGPDFVLQAWGEALEEAGIKYSLEPFDHETAGEPAHPHAASAELIHFGNSFMVAREFGCTVIDQ